MNLREALRRGEERLTRAGIADSKTDAWLLFQHVTDITRASYFLSPETELTCEKEEEFFRLVEERATHRPLQQITGTQEFMGLTFRVNENVLIPRQDTEILVEKAIEILSGEFSGRKKEKTEISEEGISGKREKTEISEEGVSGKREKTEIPEEEFHGKREKMAKIPAEEFLQEEKKVRETLIGKPSADKINYRILDLCTGSGCIAVSLSVWALRNSWPVEITATDISEEALQVARENSEAIFAEKTHEKKEKFGAETEDGADTEKEAEAEVPNSRIRFRQGDLFEAVVREKFSMILANPPYIRTEEIETLMPEVRNFEPRLALDGSADGLALYRRIAAEAPAYLEQGGRILLEIGCDEACAVCGLLAENGFCDIQVLKDYAGLDRVVCGRYELAWPVMRANSMPKCRFVNLGSCLRMPGENFPGKYSL